MKPLLMVTSEMQKPHLTGHNCSVPFEITHIESEVCTFYTSEIRTPLCTGQLPVVPVVSLIQRFHCIYAHSH